MIDAQIDNYRITEKLGDGGMGSVYKAVDVMLEREVALKFLRPELALQKDLVDRFRAEAIVLAKLTHQNIASLYGLHRHGDDLFMAMEFVPGETLESLLKREKSMPLDRAVAIAGDVLQALDYAHRRGIVHRDVKTANIIAMPTGGVKVMDFGIARVLGTERRTRVGFVVGTIGYMAPEQIQGLEVDGRADIYALGVVLYEMLTGRMPFQGDTEYAIMQAQVQQTPVPPRVFAPVPVPVENTIMRALAKLPQERFQTASEFHQALQTAVRQSEMYAAASAPYSASSDETREFKSDPLLATPFALPGGPPPTVQDAPALPVTNPSPAVTPPPLPQTTPALRAPTPPPRPATGAVEEPPHRPEPVPFSSTAETVSLPPWSASTPTQVAPPPLSPTVPEMPAFTPPEAPQDLDETVDAGKSAPVRRESDLVGRLGREAQSAVPPLPTPPVQPAPAVPPAPPMVKAPEASRPVAPPPVPPVAPPVAPRPPEKIAARPIPARPVGEGTTRTRSSKGLVALAGGLLLVAALAAVGYVIWQRSQAAPPPEDLSAQQAAVEPAAEPQTLAPPVNPGVVPVAPATTTTPSSATARTSPRTPTTSVATATVPANRVEPVPSPVPPTVIVPQLKPASPEVAKPASAPPAMFGAAKWMRVDGSKVSEVGGYLQLTDDDVRVLDDRARGTLSRMPYSAVTVVAYSSGKRPAWHKEIGPVPTESAFDSTVRTFHYLAFQGASQFLLVRVDKDDLPRLRDELKKRANLVVEPVR